MRDPVAEILRYNRRFHGRYPQLLRRKVDLFCDSPFVFFRGTFHLFCRDWVEGRLDPWPPGSPIGSREFRICADLHGENFGTYGGAHHTALYGINDFDETALGRLDFDACRAATSLLLAASRRGLLLRSGAAGAHAFIEAYVEALARPHREGDAAPIRSLLRAAEQARRTDFIRKRTELKKGRRCFRGERYFDLRPEHRAQALRLHADYLAQRKVDDDFYEVEDVQGRIAGCGSLGRLRYVVLVRGEGSKEARDLILEYKESLPSALDEARGRKVDRRNRAAEVAAATRKLQGTSDPYVGHAVDGDRSFQVRQVGPREFRLDGDALTGGRQFRETSASYGAHLAASHRRANGSAAPALLKALIGNRPEAFIRRTMSFALAYAEEVESDWRAFVKERKWVLAAWTRD